MEVLNEIKPDIYPQKGQEAETDTFENDWKTAISGDEFVRRTHEHIRKLYLLHYQ
jgi:hypothetical protein